MVDQEKKKSSMAGGVGSLVVQDSTVTAPKIVTPGAARASTAAGELVFRPYFVQVGRGPHLLDWAYATDEQWDSFHSNITASREGVKISDAEGKEKFGINVRWNVEGFGYIFITADNAGEFYSLPPAGKSAVLNLNYELARSRVARNGRRVALHRKTGWQPSREVVNLVSIAEGYLADAKNAESDGERCGALSQKALLHAMWASEKIELDFAEYAIHKRGYRPGFWMGCDARGYFQMDVELFLSLFPELFNYATITHYLISGVFEDFEPEEGKVQFDLRDALFKQLQQRNFTIEGRPLWWSYRTTTPDWLRKKSYDEVRKYVEQHVRKVVSHYGDGMYAWEVVTEFHDWANECRLKPDQIIEVTRLACDVARDTNPKVKRLINNCAPFAEYVQLGKMTELDAFYPQRTPYQFVKQLADAGVDFDITGIQMYFPYRDLADTIILIEKFESIGKTIQLTEVGASSGPSEDSINSGKLTITQEPYVWHRPWDEELQADWMEGLFTLAYSKPMIEAVNWYDFVDPYSWIPNGGFLRSPKGEKRAVWDRLKNLQERWKGLHVAPQR
jgi:endo-1,4-beta-xylanase